MIMIKRYLDRLRIWKYLITSFFHQYFIVKKGQKEEFEILQIAHRIEKGLLQKNPKPRWGWEKIERLQYLMSNAIFAELSYSLSDLKSSILSLVFWEI